MNSKPLIGRDFGKTMALHHRNEIVRFVQDLQKRDNNLSSKFSNFSAPEKTLWVEVQKAIQPNLEDSLNYKATYTEGLAKNNGLAS